MTDTARKPAAGPVRHRDEDVLRRRAERLARRKQDEQRRVVHARVVVVAAGGQHFAIRVEGLREIVPLPEVTALPDLEPWRRGLTQVRGDVLGVVDLAMLVAVGTIEPRFLAVIETSSGPMGLAVEAVIDFRDLFEDELAPGVLVTGQGQRVLAAVTRDFVGVVDVERLRQLQRAGDDAAAPLERRTR
jgi:chemotaxis signal transduction protein